jgi:Asp/Glu/hydantoin racemase
MSMMMVAMGLVFPPVGMIAFVVSGNDAFIVGFTIDPGYYKIKQILEIPVVFIGESAMHVASMIVERISMIVNDLQTA